MTRKPPPLLGTLESALYAEDLEGAARFWTEAMDRLSSPLRAKGIVE